MTDQTEDRFKGTGQFHPEKTWAKLDREAKDLAFEAKYPTKWWHSLYFTTWGLAAIGLIALSVIGLLIWLFSAPFAPR